MLLLAPTEAPTCPSPRDSGEREGPGARDIERWEGEVCVCGLLALVIDTHLTRSLRDRPLPPQAGGEGIAAQASLGTA